jgi:fluoroquinolone transport system ATP-binding protein
MIEVHDLRYRYPGASAPTLHGLDFEVREGEIFGFLGPSGSGKSTTQKLLIGLLRGATGAIAVLGRRPGQVGPDGASFYERIGVGFELPTVYGKLSARENLEFFRGLYSGPTREPMELLDRVGLAARADSRVSGFSKGMRMRLDFCRALLNRPVLLFLDEPTSGQDPGHARLLKDLVLELRAQGTTVFLTTHNMSEAAELCDRVAFIVDGSIALIDEPRALMIRHGQRRVRVEWEAGTGRESQEFGLDQLADDVEFLASLRTHAGSLAAIHTLEATLEQVFLAETGRRLA